MRKYYHFMLHWFYCVKYVCNAHPIQRQNPFPLRKLKLMPNNVNISIILKQLWNNKTLSRRVFVYSWRYQATFKETIFQTHVNSYIYVNPKRRQSSPSRSRQNIIAYIIERSIILQVCVLLPNQSHPLQVNFAFIQHT